jgi:isoleucyl-tRNA synthetase
MKRKKKDLIDVWFDSIGAMPYADNGIIHLK